MKKIAVALLIALLLGSFAIFYFKKFYRKPVSSRAANTLFESYKAPSCTEVVGEKITYKCPFKGVRIWKRLSDIAPSLIDTVILLEDAKFYSHSGLDVAEIVNSFEKNIEKGKFARGGSTITQQLAKNLFLWKGKSVLRKASEVPLALMLEKELSKKQILELYLNTIEWGYDIYGAEAAARYYFDKPAAELSTEESWLLAVMIPNPRELNVWAHPKAKKSIITRVKRLSERLVQAKVLDSEQASEAFEKFQTFLEIWQSSNPNLKENADDREARRFPLSEKHGQ